MQRFILLLSLLLFSSCTPQVQESPAIASITSDEIQEHLLFLASDQMQGRRTGEKGFLMAAEYVAREFKRLGLQPLADGGSSFNHYFVEVPLVREVRNGKRGVILAEETTEIQRGTGEFEKFSSFNIAGVLPGSDPDLKAEFIVAGAHLDHLGVIDGNVYNGANDNGSGCAALLEIAEAMALSPGRRSVIFIFFCGEEEGLLGSQYFVGNCPIGIERIKACINIDQAGRRDSRLKGILAAGSYENFPFLRDISRSASLKVHEALDYNDDKVLSDLQYRGSDHYPFHQAGIPTLVFSTLGFPEYHTPDDDIWLIDFELNRKVARVALAALLELTDTTPLQK